MELPIVERCFIYNIRVGAITLGIINVLMSLCFSVIMIDMAPSVKDEDAATGMLVHTIVIIQGSLAVVKTLIDCACVYAAYKKNISLVKKYLIFWIVYMVMFIIGFLKSLFHVGAILITVQIAYILSNLYIVIVLRSYVVLSNRDGLQ